MGKIHKHFASALLVPLFLTLCSAMPRTNIATDQSTLLSLKSHIIEDPLQILSKNWSIGSPVCEWFGVTCGARHLRVTALSISNMNLTGTIPPQLANLSFLVSLDMSANKFQGELPNEFAQLRRLKVLNFGYNSLSGQIPHSIGSLHELEYLSLRSNSFTGLIPASITNMTKLAYLVLAINSLQGNIPAELFNISSLEIISLATNKLSGSLPDNLCRKLQRLNLLSLSWNELSGQVPSSLGQCSKLQKLSLSSNSFTGEIPKDIGNLKALEILYLGDNKLKGTIPKIIGNLTILKELALSSNNLTGVIPREISNLYNLQVINFQRNKLTAQIPIEIFNLSTLRVIALTNNQFFGNLPSTMGYGLPQLEELYLSGNNFDGPLPFSISNSSKLSLIDLSYNNFSGPIPNSLGDLSLLESLNLQSNNLTSDSSILTIVTSLTNCKNLTKVSLSFNPLKAMLPYSIGNLSTSLQWLELGNCKIMGTIPSGIGNLSSLVRLYLGDNQLIGPLPTTIERLQNIQVIDIGTNRIQSSLHLFCACKNLGALDLEQNNILGKIPDCLGNITSMRYLILGANKVNSSLPESLWNLNDLLELNLSSNLLSGPLPLEMKNLKMASLIDLSRNNFEGGIPSTIGDMMNLQDLSLAHNILQGSIPETMGKMLSLKQLDLSHNFLSGSLPMSLEALQYLALFNVSFNNLSGEIPSKGSFTNFSADSFISNGALCGIQKFHVPPCLRTSTHTGRTKKMHVLVGVLGVIVIVGSMSFGFVYLRYRRKGKPSNVQADLSLVSQERISYYELQQATNGYNESNLLGTGSFGSVYKGILEDGRTVAVKVFNLQMEGGFKSFDGECEALRNLRHRNLTKVISSCSNPDFKALVLQYMSNGSLEKWLYSDDCFLNIIQRLDILIDVAYAVQYLHWENPIPVVHCDLKPSNVLLDQDMIAHVSDFGVAKLLGSEDSFTFTKTLTTLCYVAPEFGLEGFVSTKCDVYSFGIMIMEVFTGTSPSNQMFGENLDMKSWVKDSMPNRLADVIDANLLRSTGEYLAEILECISSIMEVALNCTKESQKERSNIRDVVAILKKIKLELLPYKQVLEGIKEI